MKSRTLVPALRFALLGSAPLALTLCLPVSARADAPAQPDAPRPDAPAAAEPGSPRAVVLTFFQSFSDGDSKALRAAVVADGDDERRVADAMAEVADAIGKARKAAAARFAVPEQGVKVQVVPVELLNGLTGKKIDDDTMVFSQGDRPIAVLKKASGDWKVSIKELVKQSGKKPQQNVAEMRRAVGRIAQIIRDIDVGKYATADEAAKAIGGATSSSETVEEG